MNLTSTVVEHTYVQLNDSKTFLEEIVEKLENDNQPSEPQLDSISLESTPYKPDARTHVSKIKEVLVKVEEVLVFFEQNYIRPDGKIKKVSIWNPMHWKLIGQTINFLRGLWSDIANIYKNHNPAS